jgi:hypothetical protein
MLLLDAPPIALPIAPGKAMLEAVVVVYLGVDGGESCPRLSVGDEVARLRPSPGMISAGSGEISARYGRASNQVFQKMSTVSFCAKYNFVHNIPKLRRYDKFRQIAYDSIPSQAVNARLQAQGAAPI